MNSHAIHLHFDAFDFDAPWVGGIVQWRLHGMRDCLAFGEQFGQAASAKNIAQCGGGQEARGMAVIGHLNDCTQWIWYAVVHDSVHRHGHRVLGQHLLRRHIERHCSQVDFAVIVDAGQHKEYARTASTTRSAICDHFKRNMKPKFLSPEISTDFTSIVPCEKWRRARIPTQLWNRQTMKTATWQSSAGSRIVWPIFRCIRECRLELCVCVNKIYQRKKQR